MSRYVWNVWSKAIPIVLTVGMLIQVAFVPQASAYASPLSDREFMVEHTWDFENDMAEFFARNGSPIELDSVYNHTENGQTSMKITAIDGKYHVQKSFNEPQREKAVSIWFYDEDPTVQNQVFFIAENGDDSKLLDQIMVGPIANTDKYGYRVKGGGVDEIVTLLDRSAGWHKFTIDYSLSGQATVSIDDNMATAGTITGVHGTSYGFSKLRIQDAWPNNEDNPVTQSAYFDDLTLSSVKDSETSQYIPTNPITNDLENLFGWTPVPDFESYTNYEYSIDGGAQFLNVTANPQPVPDEALEPGAVQVRLKSDMPESGEYEALASVVGFTPSDGSETVKKYETIEELSGYHLPIGRAEISKKASRSGTQALALIPTLNSDGKPRINAIMDFGGKQKGKYINIWYYDAMETEGAIQVTAYDESTDVAGKKVKTALTFAVNIGTSPNKYVYRTTIPGVASDEQRATEVPRSLGWHRMTWDYSDGESAKLFIDGIEVKSIVSSGFTHFSIQDAWSLESHIRYFDDFTITNVNTTVEVPDAPTIPVVNDEENTFGWMPLPANPEPGDYEISYDFGGTFDQATINPQPVGGSSYETGQIMVRLKAINGRQAGTVLRSDASYTSTANESLTALRQQVEFAKALFEPDYEANEWTAVETAIDAAEGMSEASSQEELMLAHQNLEMALEALEPVIEDEVRYEFEAGQDVDNPFTAAAGSLTKGEDISVFGIDTFEHYLNKHGAALQPAFVDGKYKGAADYTFAKPLSNKVVGIGTTVTAETQADTEYMLYDENNNYVGFRSTRGNQTDYEFVYRVNGPEIVVPTEMRRLNNNFILSWDMVNNPGNTILYFNGVYMGKAEGFDSFNRIRVETANGTDENEYVKFDRLTITEKNPTTGIAIKDEQVRLGYYDTYDLAKPVLTLTTEKTYPTTDVFTYTATDSDVVNVTSEGSIEAMNVGASTVTVSSSSGATASINVEVADIKTEQIFITDAPYIDIVAMGKPGQDSNNSSPVTKADAMQLEPGESRVLNAVITPKNATARLADWSTSDSNVAHVKDGLVTGVNIGTATISIRTNDGTELMDSVTVTVAEPVDDYGAEIFVATDGDDSIGDGTIDHPFQSLERARDEIRSLKSAGGLPAKGVAVYLREGMYTFDKTFILEAQDSGTEESPITFKAYRDEEVTFLGGVAIDPAQMSKVTPQDPLYERIPNADKVYAINLAPYGLEFRKEKVIGFPNLKQKYGNGYNDFEFEKPYYQVFFNNEPMVLSRFPNTDFIKTTQIIEKGENPRFWESDLIANGLGKPYQPGYEYETFSFTSKDLPASKLATWGDSVASNDGGAWMAGFWGVVYRSETVPIGSITDNIIKAGLNSNYEPKPNMKFYVYNLIEELDTEGEWFIDFLQDKSQPVLYFFPPANTDMSSSTHKLTIPMLDDVMVHINEADYITFDGIDFEATNNGIVKIEGGQHNVVKHANISNTANGLISIGNSEDRIAKHNGLALSNVFSIDGGVSLGGGDPNTLERGYNFVENTSFRNFSLLTRAYNPAVGIGGVGNRVTNSTFTDAPHSAINFDGPESTMEFLEVYDVLRETGDQGTIYTGRDTLNRGAVIRNSYFHDIGNSTHVSNSAIYLDDERGGVAILDNVIDNTTWGIKFSSGRDIDIIGNQMSNLQVGLVTMPGHLISIGPWYTHGYRLIAMPNNLNVITDVPWDDPNGAYGRFEHLHYIYQDNPAAGKYVKIIDNQFINMYKDRDPNETIVDYNIWSKFWKIQSYETQKATIDDWFFDKNNQRSNNKGDDDPSLKTKYAVTVDAAGGEGTVTGSGAGFIKGVNRKVTATPVAGYTFVHWTQNGQVVSESPIYFFEINADVHLVAHFEEGETAEPMPAIAAVDKIVAAGESFSLPVTLEHVADLGRLKATIQYDEQLLTLDDVVFTDAFTTKEYNDSIPGRITFDAVNEGGITSDSTIFATLEFRAAADISEMSVAMISFVDIEANKTTEEPYSMTAQPYTITIDLLIEPGDISGDGNIDGLDALMLMKHLTNIAKLTAQQEKAADYDGNGVLDIADVLKMLQKSVGLLD